MIAPLDVTELATRADIPADQVRRYADAGLLPHGGTRSGYPVTTARTVRLLAGAERLGVAGPVLSDLAGAWHSGDCDRAQQRLSEALHARLADVQAELSRLLAGAATDGPGTDGWAEQTRASLPLAEDAARLQAAITALDTTSHTGPCDDACGCTVATTVAGERYRFATDAALACDLAADGGDAQQRIGVWQQVFTHVRRRDPLPDTATGLALRFALDADLAASLARLAAAEYRCCSFGSYTLVIDHHGLTLEVRMPHGAGAMLAAVVGRPDQRGVAGAADQP